jgi:5-hydroxyisourate hydrolase-like protein (transthyretin family)
MLRKMSMLLSIVALSILSVEAATVSGVVKEGDSTGAAVDSAIVTLTATGTGGVTLRDTTDATGAYSFSSVSIGTRQIRAAKTGYNTMAQSTINIADSTATYTRDLYLVPIVYGSITGTVTDSVAGTPIEGAKVYLRSTGGGAANLDSAMTAANGTYTIAHVQTTIARTLRVQDSGFVTKNTPAVTLADTAALTVDIQLVKILYGSITGRVTDSAAGTPIEGAKVYLRSTGGGGGAILDSAMTAANGTYTIAHVQTNIVRTLRVQDSGFVTKNTTITVPDTAALVVNVELRIATVAIASPNAQGILGKPDFYIARSGLLRLSNCSESGTIMVFGVQGRLLYRAAIGANTTSLALPAHFAKSGNSYIVGITQNNVVYRKQVIMP